VSFTSIELPAGRSKDIHFKEDDGMDKTTLKRVELSPNGTPGGKAMTQNSWGCGSTCRRSHGSASKTPYYLKDGSGRELKYTHFFSDYEQIAEISLLHCGQHRRPALEDLPRDRDVWYFDPRIERKYQMDAEGIQASE